MKPWPEGFEIRNATLDDVDDLAEIHVDAWEAAYRGILPDELIDERDFEMRRRTWRERLPKMPVPEFVRVGVLDGRVVAFFEGEPNEDDPEVVDGRALYLRSDVQGMGIGTHMRLDYLRTAKDYGFRTLTFWIVKENEQARRFYAGPEWEQTGRERPMEGGKFHEIEFALDLSKFDLAALEQAGGQ
jgi:GNAT superfamily N-acetyltransferase